MDLAVAIAGCGAMIGFLAILTNIFTPTAKWAKAIWIAVFALLTVASVVLVIVQEHQICITDAKRDASITEVREDLQQLKEQIIPKCAPVSAMAIDKLNALDKALATIQAPKSRPMKTPNAPH